jgi:hypothetical protein
VCTWVGDAISLSLSLSLTSESTCIASCIALHSCVMCGSALACLLVVRSRVGVLSGGTGRLFAVEARGAIGFSGYVIGGGAIKDWPEKLMIDVIGGGGVDVLVAGLLQGPGNLFLTV